MLINKKSVKKSEKDASEIISETQERPKTMSSKQGTPKAKTSKMKSLSRPKDISEVKHALLQLKCKINDHGLDTDLFIDKIIFDDNSKLGDISENVLENKLQSFMQYPYQEEVSDLARFLSDNKDTVKRQSLKSVAKTSLKFHKLDHSSGKNFMLIKSSPSSQS